MIISVGYRVNSKQGIQFVINNGFIVGNKRIAAACFLLFLEKNQILYNGDGEAIISNNTLAVLTLFVAAIKPESLSRRMSGKWIQ
nr:virulence RhuM family protein [Lunatibacter salilacus]